ncbi:hypothetical protein PpBr36_02229 [Pyricularia pennisetigena]|uniref:hypothetical protein n=1 Tax=Pyricularia pennisetigena TaxID=1578925 RepID=UPI00114EA551|nr:hypothetical protein PpBr36_02229 [Pyricularia pennisetigena]TLS31616.1 hypothetical protein PpBr36_02229 [Pyricularia pennisetigena]
MQVPARVDFPYSHSLHPGDADRKRILRAASFSTMNVERDRPRPPRPPERTPPRLNSTEGCCKAADRKRFDTFRDMTSIFVKEPEGLLNHGGQGVWLAAQQEGKLVNLPRFTRAYQAVTKASAIHAASSKDRPGGIFPTWPVFVLKSVRCAPGVRTITLSPTLNLPWLFLVFIRVTIPEASMPRRLGSSRFWPLTVARSASERHDALTEMSSSSSVSSSGLVGTSSLAAEDCSSTDWSESRPPAGSTASRRHEFSAREPSWTFFYGPSCSALACAREVVHDFVCVDINTDAVNLYDALIKSELCVVRLSGVTQAEGRRLTKARRPAHQGDRECGWCGSSGRTSHCVPTTRAIPATISAAGSAKPVTHVTLSAKVMRSRAATN